MTSSMIDYERMVNERQAISKWDGKLPEIMAPNSTLPFINLKKKTQQPE
jgi:hypothetical protein